MAPGCNPGVDLPNCLEAEPHIEETAQVVSTGHRGPALKDALFPGAGTSEKPMPTWLCFDSAQVARGWYLDLAWEMQ